VDRRVARRGAEPGDLGVVADLEDERMLGRPVRPRLEEQRVALRAELVGDLLGRDRVDLRLDLAGRHARVEDLHVRPEIGRPGDAARRQHRRQPDADQHRHPPHRPHGLSPGSLRRGRSYR
jgi:hypothetical protein